MNLIQALLDSGRWPTLTNEILLNGDEDMLVKFIGAIFIYNKSFGITYNFYILFEIASHIFPIGFLEHIL